MDKAVRILTVLGVMVCLCFATAMAQDLRASLFTQIDQVLEKTDQTRAQLLSPTNYKRGMEKYRAAEKALDRGDNIQDIREKLDEAARYFNKAREATKLAQVSFASALSAREDAMDANAKEFASRKWRDAEEEFNGAVRELEDGDARDAKREGANAEKLYREAELTAIKSNILSSARTLLEQAERRDADDQAPKTLRKTRSLIKETEKALEGSRYDTDNARNLAKQAEYEARHTLYLHRYIEELDRADKTREEVVLAAEEPLDKVANQLLINAEFDNGLDSVANVIIAQINVLNDSIYTQQQKIEELNQNNQNLLAQNEDLRSQLENLTNERAQISERVEVMNQFREQFRRINNLFNKDEARVFRDQNDAVIRLIGLNFDVGSSVIKQNHFGLLTKVKQAINTFPGCTVVIEGHTDSQGGDELNLQLSQERANAVMSYLLANMDIEPLRLEAVGYGEGSPIANNETEQGRTLNRRIDVIIKPRNL